jgi:hypothetical protein
MIWNSQKNARVSTCDSLSTGHLMLWTADALGSQFGTAIPRVVGIMRVAKSGGGELLRTGGKQGAHGSLMRPLAENQLGSVGGKLPVVKPARWRTCGKGGGAPSGTTAARADIESRNSQSWYARLHKLFAKAVGDSYNRFENRGRGHSFVETVVGDAERQLVSSTHRYNMKAPVNLPITPGDHRPRNPNPMWTRGGRVVAS